MENDDRHDNHPTIWKRHQVLDEVLILKFLHSIIGDGIRIEGNLKRLIHDKVLKHRYHHSSSEIRTSITFAEYHILLFGEKIPMTQALADSCRKILEEAIKKRSISQWLGTRRASQVYPSYLLHHTRATVNIQ